MTDATYAGDILPRDVWTALEVDPAAVLVDVRTAAEIEYVGRPDLAAVGRELVAVEWLHFPSCERNPDFTAALAEAVPEKDVAVYFICRSGVRSRDAAEEMTALGYRQCYNVAHGFEGDKNAAGHRGTVNGWKVAGLPWSQG